MTVSYLLDTHVHFYPCFEINTFFNSAYDHFQTAIKQHGLHRDSLGCLFLTEKSNENFFHLFKSLTNDRWQFYPTEEEDSLIVIDEHRTILLIAGRQIVTKEKLEVLALGTSAYIKEGNSLYDTIQTVEQQGAVPVIPWGFGKWWGKRGKIIKEILSSQIFLGDNGGRPRWGTDPTLFRIASSKGIPILPGSDPLPFKSQERNTGRCGVIVDGEIDLKRPGEGIKKMVRSLRTQPKTYGKGERLIPFIINQIRMQMRKYIK